MPMIKARQILPIIFSTRTIGGGSATPSAGTFGTATVIAALLMSAASAEAATPISQINYQGVLRNASDAPLDGDYDMIFRFWSARVIVYTAPRGTRPRPTPGGQRGPSTARRACLSGRRSPG